MDAPGRQLRAEPAARLCFGLLGLLGLVGVILSLRNGILDASVIDHAAGHHREFTPGWANLTNQFFYFTFMSNLLVAVTSLVLALRPRIVSPAFHVVHISGIICILITGVVFNVLLRNDTPLPPLALFHDTIQHIITPILAPLLWVVLGPKGRAGLRCLMFSTIIPIGWLVITLIRGEVLGWYPYGILDVATQGYGPVMVYVAAILGFYMVVAGLMWLVDRRRHSNTSAAQAERAFGA